MPKAIPECPPKPKPALVAVHLYQIELITPMFGGGVVAGTVDTGFPIRPTAIRGHLRYWWRLSRGLLLGQDMWRREEEIFGSTEFSSPVEVCVHNGQKPELMDASEFDRFGTEAYALFAAGEGQHQIFNDGL